MNKVIQINKSDNVVVAAADIKAGERLSTADICVEALCDIPAGHKLAVSDINVGEDVIKYGSLIGHATADIRCGEHVHTHNLKTSLSGTLEYTYNPSFDKEVNITTGRTFMGFERSDGTAGVRNEIWIIPTVGCVNNIASKIASICRDRLPAGVDDVVALTHPYGCSQLGDDQENTRQVLARLVHHPNAAGVLVLGLGCENSNIGVLKSYIGDVDDNRVKFLVAQDSEDEIKEGTEIVDGLMKYASKFTRKPVPLSKLTVGLKCGGSDGFSGITANPVVGAFSDILNSLGGSTILTEVPEMFGAETILMNRCVDKSVFEKTVSLINDFKQYFISHGQNVYENPSPGNKAGGISTLEDKSLGCVQKSGSFPVCGVLKYAEPICVCGLNLLCAPGNDLVAATALAVSGAQIILFTTGRGTPFSCVVPTVKISSNSSLYNRKKNWIDFDAGKVIESGDIDAFGAKLFDFVISVAEGKKVVSEAEGYHDLAIFKQGVTL